MGRCWLVLALASIACGPPPGAVVPTETETPAPTEAPPPTEAAPPIAEAPPIAVAPPPTTVVPATPPAFADRHDVPTESTQSIAVGHGFSCSLDDGALTCWGGDGQGGTSVGRLPAVGGLDHLTSIDAGGSQLCGVRRGHVRCVGYREELGRFEPRALEVRTVVDAIALSVDTDWMCALRRGGSVTCWQAQELRSFRRRSVDPEHLFAELEPLVEVSTGVLARCVRRATGAVHCDGSYEQRMRPRLTGAVSLDVSRVSCAALEDGSVWCWGENGYGQLGDGTTTDSSLPVRVRGLPFAAVSVRVSTTGACARSADGEVACWGSGADGLPGTRGLHALGPPPTPVVTHARELALDLYHACVRDDAGALWCWGANDGGESGPRPTEGWAEIPGLEGITVLRVGETHACAIDGTQRVWCWGTIEAGGRSGALVLDAPRPVEIPGLAGAHDVTLGEQSVCAVVHERVRCFGGGTEGLLAAPTSDAVDVPGTEGATALASIERRACFVRAGQVWCWGALYDLIPRPTALDPDDPARITRQPVRIEGIDDASEIAVGPFGCARRSGGAYVCWGGGLDRSPVDYQAPYHDRWVPPSPIAALEGAEHLELGRAGGCARFGAEVRCASRGGETIAFEAVPELADVATLSAGQYACGAWTDGHARCSGPTARLLQPYAAPEAAWPTGVEPLVGVRTLVAGRVVCALLESGRVACRGPARGGTLGDGREAIVRVPTRVDLSGPAAPRR